MLLFNPRQRYTANVEKLCSQNKDNRQYAGGAFAGLKKVESPKSPKTFFAGV